MHRVLPGAMMFKRIVLIGMVFLLTSAVLLLLPPFSRVQSTFAHHAGQTSSDIPSAAMGTTIVQGATNAMYSALKQGNNFVLARTPEGSTGLPSGEPQMLARFSAGFGEDQSDKVLSLHLSPDRRYVAIDGTRESGEQVWVYDSEQQRLLLTPSYAMGSFLHWLPDGHSFLFRAMQPMGTVPGEGKDGWRPGLWVIDAASGAYRNIALPVSASYLIDATPSPDGKRLIFSATPGLGQGSETWLMNMDGSAIEPLFSTTGSAQSLASMFAWSPNGSMLAYELLSDAPTPFLPARLYVMRMSGKFEQAFVTDVDGGHGYEPSWSPDGRRIAFVTRTNVQDQRANVDGQALQGAVTVVDLAINRLGVVATQDQVQSSIGADPAWMADGAHLLIAASASATQPPHFWTAAVDVSRGTPLWPAKQDPFSAPGNGERVVPWPLPNGVAQMSHGTFMHHPYYGQQTLLQRTISYFDHDKPWYVVDGLFVRYDGKQWHNVPLSSCKGGVNCYDGHNGYDFDLWYEPVLSAAAGTVIMAGWNDPRNHEAALGLSVEIDHGNGYVTAYGHLSALLVKVGDKVQSQWQIGTSGDSGAAAGPHLHFSTFLLPNWDATDPFGWSGKGKDPNTVADHYLWVDNVDAITRKSQPRLSDNGQDASLNAMIVDDRGQGWSSTGQWESTSDPSAYKGQVHLTQTSVGPESTASATWQTMLPRTGYYEVGAFISNTYATSSWVPYTVYGAVDKKDIHTVYVDETHLGTFKGPYDKQSPGPQWISLGTYYFDSSQPGRVVVSNATGEANAQIEVDAVEFVPVSLS